MSEKISTRAAPKAKHPFTIPVEATRYTFKLPKVLARRGGKVGRPPKNIRPKFTPEQMETAIQVVMYSKTVYNWVVSEAEFLGVDLNTPEGHEFFKKNAREAALRLVG